MIETQEVMRKTMIYCEKAHDLSRLLPSLLNIFRTPGLILSYNPDIKDASVFVRNINNNTVFVLIIEDGIRPTSFITQITGMVTAKRRDDSNLKLAIAGNEAIIDLYGRLTTVNYALRGVYDIGAVEKILSYKSNS